MTPAERARRYRARRGATPRGEPAPCGTLAAWNRHIRQRARLRRTGTPEADLPPIDDACRQAAQTHQQTMRARRTAGVEGQAPALTPPAPVPQAVLPAVPAVVPGPAGKAGRLQRRTDPRTAATYYVWWHPAGVHLEARRRLFPDGRRRWELHHLPGSTIPQHATPADPVGDNWTRLTDLRHDLNTLTRALNTTTARPAT